MKFLLLQSIIVAALALFPLQLLAANITAKLDRSPVLQDETFHLTYESDSDVDDNPDFKAIYNLFDVLNSSQSTNMRLINGQYSLKRTWDLTLISSKAGSFTIPSIPFGKDLSPAVRVTVAKNSAHAKDINTAELFVEVVTDKKSAYIGSEIIFTARLVRSIDINQGSFTELKVSDPDAILINLGNVPQYTRTRNGKRYTVNEIRYAVYPQHSGKLTFEPLLFEGRISQKNSRSLFDQFFQAGKLKRVRSKEISINIKPKPGNINLQDWLPAKNIVLKDSWSGDLSNIPVGEPVTRTILINANGYTAEQLPELNFNAFTNIKQYPDQAILKNTNTSNGVNSSKQIKVAIIPTKSGQYTLPEIVIPWWNTKTNRQEFARLPEVILNAIQSTQNQAVPFVPETPEPIAPVTIESVPSKSDDSIWIWLSGFLALGWLLSVIYFVTSNRNKTKNKKPVTTKKPPKLSIKPYEKAIKNACQSNDAAAAKDALLKWAKIYWDDENISSLADISKRGTITFSDVISQLNTALYGSNQLSWKGSDLLNQFNKLKPINHKKNRESSSVLEPLYK